MGLATNTKTEWGYYVTGDTDPTTIWTDGRKYVRTVVFVPSGTADYVIMSSAPQADGTFVNWLKMGSGGVAGEAQCPWNLGDGIPADNLKIQLSSGTGQLYIYLR